MLQEVERFLATGSDGKIYTIVGYEYLSQSGASDSDAVSGFRTYKTSEGHTLKTWDNLIFELLVDTAVGTSKLKLRRGVFRI